MADFANLDVYSIVTLVDRACQGGPSAEFIYDGIRFSFVNAKGEPVMEKTVPKFVAAFLFVNEKYRVWTKPVVGQAMGQFVNRYAIKDCPEELIALWGPEVADTSAIEIDTSVIEGSDAPLYRTGPVRVQPINIPPNERPRDRQGRSAVMVGQER
jgi:hypothetical protein